MSERTGPVTGEDGLARCPWGAGPGMMRDYHDTEWGTRVHGEAAYFERLSLEAFQSGLSWSTILTKRPAFRTAFAGFDPERVAGFDDADVARLMADAAIVRNRRKVEATISNAAATLALRDSDVGGLEELVTTFAPGGDPEPAYAEQVQAVSPASTALSKELKRRGFTFVGPTTMQALMEALGLFDPHLTGCHRRGRQG